MFPSVQPSNYSPLNLSLVYDFFTYIVNFTTTHIVFDGTVSILSYMYTLTRSAISEDLEVRENVSQRKRKG